MTAALEGQRCVVTGANTGIGFVIASALARDGADVTLVCRNPDRGAAAVDAIRDATGNPRVRLAVCDVGDPGAVRACCDRLSNGGSHIDVLVNNAGVWAPRRQLTPAGRELMLAINHLGPFLMTNLLLDRLAGARVITTSS
jgi:NAD(P)-dependent dehydrogenase (short-subunit alcohol dehydrogenase family)